MDNLKFITHLNFKHVHVHADIELNYILLESIDIYYE